MRLLAALFILAGAVWGQAAIDREAIGLMPEITPQVRNKCYRAYDKSAQDWRRLDHKIKECEKFLKTARGVPAQKARTELARLRKMVPELSKHLKKRFFEAGLTEAQLERLKAMPRGAARTERYNHSVVLELPDLRGEQRTLLEHLIAATDAAQLALVANREHLKRGFGKDEAMVKRQIDARTNQQLYNTEKRFWRVAYYVLSPAQMRATRKLLAPRTQGIPQVREQMMMVPDLTPSQASRVTATFTEHESECTADQAEVRRIRVQMRDKNLPKPERQALQQRMNQAYQRLGKLNQGLRESLQQILSQEQRDALNSAPPHLNIGERGRTATELARGLVSSGEQRQRVQALNRETQRFRQTVQKDQREANSGMMGAGLGPESPQRMTMMVMYRSAQARMQDHMRQQGRKLVLTILTPTQVAAYVVGSQSS